MTTSVTGITADLRLETAAFIRDLSKASAAVARNTSQMTRSMRVLETGFANAAGFVRGFIATLVSVQGLRALANLGKSAIDTADNIGAAAAKLGIGAEALQRFRFAAAQTDVDTSELDNALKLFQKNLATGKIKSSTDDITASFTAFIDNIRAAPTQLEKTQIATAAFGKGAQVALSIAADSTNNFAKNMAAANVITDEAIGIASDLDNRMRALKNAASTGFDTGFLTEFQGALGDDDASLKTLHDNMRLFGKAAADVFKAIIAAAKSVPGVLDGIGEAFSDIIPADFSAKMDAAAAKIRTSFLPAGESFDPGVLAKNTTTVGKSVPGNPFAPEGSPSLAQSADEATVAIKANADALKGWEATTTDALGRSLELDDMLREGKSLFADMQTPLEQHASSLERLSKLYAVGAIDAETFARANQQLTLGMANNWLGAAGAVSGALTQMFKENKAIAIANAVINTAEAITSALKNPPGPPFSFVYAAAAAVSGAAQIATILSAQPGSSKTPSVRGSGKKIKADNDNTTTAPARAGAASTSSSASKPQQTAVNITIVGESGFSREQVRSLIGQINEAVGDGATIRVAQ